MPVSDLCKTPATVRLVDESGAGAMGGVDEVPGVLRTGVLYSIRPLRRDQELAIAMVASGSAQRRYWKTRTVDTAEDRDQRHELVWTDADTGVSHVGRFVEPTRPFLHTGQRTGILCETIA